MDKTQLTTNWAETKSVLLEGLTPTQAKIVEPLMETTRQQMLNETAASGSTDAASIAGFHKIVIPMIRRIIPGTIATELVGVQPMTGPVGQVYSLRYKYAEALNANTNSSNNPFGDGSEADFSANNEAFGNAKPIRQFYSGATDGGGQTAGASTPGGSNITGNGVGGGWGANTGFSALDSVS